MKRMSASLSMEGDFARQDFGGAATQPGPEVVGGAENEDLFVFTVENVTLKKDQRMVLPVAEYELPYEDVFALSIPFTPPAEVWRNFNAGNHSQLA